MTTFSEQRVAELDALSRTKALSEAESIELERHIRRVEAARQSRRRKGIIE